ncbi:unnamed protein product, partial [Didymodactylos carnosus]
MFINIQIYILTFILLLLIPIESRSVFNVGNNNDNNEIFISNELREDDKKAILTLTGYRHRFDHSHNLKLLKLSSVNYRDTKALCEFCDLVVPIARILIEYNETAHIENVVIGICKDFKLFDPDVCVGAVHEYK